MPEALRDRSASGTDGVLERAVERLHSFVNSRKIFCSHKKQH
jgi:hypothetical protein